MNNLKFIKFTEAFRVKYNFLIFSSVFLNISIFLVNFESWNKYFKVR